MSRLINNYLAYDEGKMFTRLVAQFEVLDMTESQRAIYFAREKHFGKIRKGTNQPYIVHPLSMASIAMDMNLRDDNLIATIILHDVIEETTTKLEDLPVNDIIKQSVKRLTIVGFEGETKTQTKVRYFRELLDDKNAIITKAIDRYDNLCTMAGILKEDNIKKNIIETDQLLLPILRTAKDRYPELTPTLYLLRRMIRGINETLANVYNVELKGEILFGGREVYINEFQKN